MSLNQLISPIAPLSVSLKSVAIAPGGAITMGTGATFSLPSEDNRRIVDTLSGPWASPLACVVRLLKLPGNAILLTLAMSADTATSADIIRLDTPLPVGFRPSVSATYFTVPIIDNATYSAGMLQIETSGYIFISTGSAGQFAGAGITGIPSVVEVVFRAAADP